jgi:hypothetical protein
MTSPFPRALLLALLLSPCGGGAASDPGCTPENCANLVKCGFVMAGFPNVRECATKTGTSSNETDVLPYCPASCSAGHGGTKLACLADPATACLLPACQKDDDPLDRVCVDRCETKRGECEGRCSSSDYHACVDCSARCGLALIDCLNGCPKAS